MLKFLAKWPWKRIVTILGSIAAAAEVMPESTREDPKAWIAVGLAGLAGAATNAERVFAAKKKAAEGK